MKANIIIFIFISVIIFTFFTCQVPFEDPFEDPPAGLVLKTTGALVADGQSVITFEAALKAEGIQRKNWEIKFTVISDAGTFQTPNPITNSAGKATGRLTVGTKAGTYTVYATVKAEGGQEYSTSLDFVLNPVNNIKLSIDGCSSSICSYPADSTTTIKFIAEVDAILGKNKTIEFQKLHSYGGVFLASDPIHVPIISGTASIDLKLGHTSGAYSVTAKFEDDYVTKPYELTAYNFITLDANNLTTTPADGSVISFSSTLNNLTLASQGNQIITYKVLPSTGGEFIPANGQVVADPTTGVADINFKLGYLPTTYTITASYSIFSASESLLLTQPNNITPVTLSSFISGDSTYADNISKIRVDIDALQYTGEEMKLDLISGDGKFVGNNLATKNITLNGLGQGLVFISVGRINGNFKVQATHISNGGSNFWMSNDYTVHTAYPAYANLISPSNRTIEKMNQTTTTLNGININFTRQIGLSGVISDNIPVLLEFSLSNNTSQPIGNLVPPQLTNNGSILFNFTAPTVDLDTLQQLYITTKIDSFGTFLIDTFKLDIEN